jgi:chain length determinant protein tyrosine kinase EpsG
LAASLLRSLDVRPSRESNVITVGFAHTDARFSAAAANAFVQGYIDTSLELRVSSAREYTKLFDERARQLRDAVDAAQERLAAFQRQSGFITDSRQDIEGTRLAELSTQLVTLEALEIESRSRQAAASARAEQMPEVLGNPVVAQLNAEIAREEVRMRELNERLGDAHPQVIEQRARIAELQSRVSSATARASGSVGVADSVNRARLARLNEALEAQRAKVLQMRSARNESSVLERDIENAQRAYEAMLQRIDQTSLVSKLTQTNAAVIKRASEPTKPSSPNMMLNTAAALLAGTVLGLTTILLRELFDRRLRTPQDILIELQQPLLVTLPVVRTALASRETGRVHLIKARVLSGLPRPGAELVASAGGATEGATGGASVAWRPSELDESSEREEAQVIGRSIGNLLREAQHLTDAQIDRVLAYQKEKGLRFGEAAVALDLVSNDDVVWALSQQFHYPYAPSGSIANAEVVVATSPFTDDAEVFRELRSQLLMGPLADEQPRRALAVLSPNVGDGKTFVAANLAAAFSQLDGRTLLIDADMRTPRLQDVFSLGPSLSGLSSILSGRADADVIRQVPGMPNLFVLPAGAVPPNPLELVQHPAFGMLIRELLGKFDHVVVDTPAMSHGADSRVIAARCGAALVVGRRGHSRMDAVSKLTDALSHGPAKLAGIILNDH